MGLVGRAGRGLYVGNVKTGSDPLSKPLRILGRLFLWVVVAQLCSAAHAPGAEGQDRKVVLLLHAAEGLQPVSIAVDEGIRTTPQATAGRPLEFHTAFLDRSWFSGEVYEQRLFPLSAGRSLLGVLSFDSIHGGQTWPDELVQRLRLLGEVFVGALERRRLELSLAERLRFETLLSEQTAKFSSLSATDVDREIERAPGRIVDCFEADRGTLAEFSRDSRMARITDRWVAKGANILARRWSQMEAQQLREELTPVGRVSTIGDLTASLAHELNQPLTAILKSATGNRTLVLLTAKESSAAVRVAVRDSGAGVDEADLDRIFQAFYTTKNTGLGMGLAIARPIFEAHGGRLGTQNNAEGGATFSFTLPVSEQGS